jgi:hypothetical protein
MRGKTQSLFVLKTSGLKLMPAGRSTLGQISWLERYHVV